MTELNLDQINRYRPSLIYAHLIVRLLPFMNNKITPYIINGRVMENILLLSTVSSVGLTEQPSWPAAEWVFCSQENIEPIIGDTCLSLRFDILGFGRKILGYSVLYNPVTTV